MGPDEAPSDPFTWEEERFRHVLRRSVFYVSDYKKHGETFRISIPSLGTGFSLVQSQG